MGDVKNVRQQLESLEHEFSQLDAQIKGQQASGSPVDETIFQQLFEIDQRRKALLKQLESVGEEEKPAEQRPRLLREQVTEDEIAEIVSAWTGIPVSRMMETERAKLLVMEDRIHQRVVGQNEAVEAVANAVRRNRSGLQDPSRPIGSFLFLGPTGVGKTELCKALAEIMFDDENAMIRVDMSEFMEKHTVSRLIGAPPGYIGFDEGGKLTEAVRRRPYSVVLLDEIEKAHPDVFNVLLQVLDDGRLTDNHGRTVDFTNTIVVMTSNIGSLAIQRITEEGGGDREIQAAVEEAVEAHMLPEFINRIDEKIIFHPLRREQIRQIVDLQLAELSKRLDKKGIRLEVSDPARTALAAAGYDPRFGARPLKRVIQHKIENPLATELLRIDDWSGRQVKIDAYDDGFTIEILPVAEQIATS